MSTLSDGVTTVTFSDDLMWQDEFAWRPVEQSQEYTITGALIVQSAERLAGQPITLAAPYADSGWLLRSALDQFLAWSAVPGKQMTLTYRGTTVSVVWRHQDGAIEASPVRPFADVQTNDYYRATLRLLRAS